MAPTNMKHQSRITKPKTRPVAQEQSNEIGHRLMVVLKLSASKKQEQTSLFFTKLPAEIRLMIYEYALPSHDPFCEKWFKVHQFSVLDVCQTFRNESMKMYGQDLEAEIVSTWAAYDSEARRAVLTRQTNFKDLFELAERRDRANQLLSHLENLDLNLDLLRGMGYTG